MAGGRGWVLAGGPGACLGVVNEGKRKEGGGRGLAWCCARRGRGRARRRGRAGHVPACCFDCLSHGCAAEASAQPRALHAHLARIETRVLDAGLAVTGVEREVAPGARRGSDVFGPATGRPRPPSVRSSPRSRSACSCLEVGPRQLCMHSPPPACCLPPTAAPDPRQLCGDCGPCGVQRAASVCVWGGPARCQCARGQKAQAAGSLEQPVHTAGPSAAAPR